MTSFHDILGTDQNTSGADVKRRYKLLSNRCHPDKGGSKVLMQLIGQAYEQVNNGKGHEEAVLSVYVKDPDAQRYKRKLQQLERELEAVKLANESLFQQLQDEQLKNKQAAEADERNASAAEDEVNWLRRENRRLRKQLEEARWELSGKGRAVKPAPAASMEDSSSTIPPINEIPPKILSQINIVGWFNPRKLAVSLMLPSIIAVLLLGLGKEPWQALLAMFDEPVEKPQARVTILDSNPADSKQLQAQPVQSPQQAIPEKPKPVPRIQLEGVVGVWQLRYFENTGQPYIGVRSEGGSYIIKSCDGGFQYYRNSSLRSSRLPANLFFDKKDRHFLIYNIPYGNGSFAANWAASKSLLINKEYFSNNDFTYAYERLQLTCQ